MVRFQLEILGYDPKYSAVELEEFPKDYEQ